MMPLIATIKKAIHKASGQSATNSADGWQDAVQRWELVVKENPDDHEAAIQLFNAATLCEEEASIEQLATNLQENFADIENVQNTLARYFVNSGQTERGLNKWQQIHSEYPDSSEALNSMAYIYLKFEDTESALTHIHKLSELPNTEAMVNKLHARVLCQQENWGEAIGYCLATLEIDGSDGQERFLLASTYFKNNQFSEALAQVEEITPDGANDSKLLLMKQQLNMKLSQWEQALHANSELRKLTSDTPTALFDQANILFNLGRYDESDVICKRELERDGKDARIMKLYARVGQARAKSLNAA